jgi:ATP-dependent DNA helicase RecQ
VASKPRPVARARAARPSQAALRKAALRLGIEELRPEQEQVIREVVAGHDVLMILPTGFGKSACYQIPSLLMPRPVLVLSPLLALLRDQHEKLLALDVPCVRIDGTVRGRNRKAALERIEEGGSLLVMTTPESLNSPELRERLLETGISLAAVDEAHCISEWGHDFRPAYLRLGASLEDLGAPPLLALTATATERVRETIVRSMRMREPTVVASSPHRSNLAFEVLPCEGDTRLRATVRLLRRLRRPGIVYCSTKREVDLVYAILRRFDIPAHRYHGGMTSKERNTEQERFMTGGRRTVMIATSAFGLGIDKPDIRFVLHFQGPASLEQYVQEAGRAGRDGKKANCILLFDSTDRSIHEALLARSRVRPDQLYRLGAALEAWSDEQRHPSLEALALSAELGPRIASALLTRLEEAGLVAFEDDSIRVLHPDRSIEEDARSLAGQFETLRTQDSRRLDILAQYASTPECRASFLTGYFGEDIEGPCGLCDFCLSKPARSDGFFAPLIAPKPPRGRGRQRGRGRPAARGARPGARTSGAGRRPTRVEAPAVGGEAEGGTPTHRPGRRRSRRGRGRRGGSREGAPRAGQETEAGTSAAPRPPTKDDATGSSEGEARRPRRRGGRGRGRRGGRRRPPTSSS